MVQISGSLLAADFAHMERDVQRAQDAGVDSFHVDFMDGHYVPNLALAPYHLKALAPKTLLPFQVHLELANPDEILDSFEPFPAEMVIVQWDTCPDPMTSFERIRSRHARVGLGLLPSTPVEPILPLLSQIDMLLLLGVEPGFGGQPMHNGTLSWLAQVRSMVDDYSGMVSLAVDGGVKASNAAEVVAAGADVLIMGTGLFSAPDMKELVHILKDLER
jgi:ribulose-phosphate 3-epimerase